MKIDRSNLISSFASFALEGNGVVVGAPGVGKTHALASLHQKLKREQITPLIIPVESLGEASPAEIAQFAGRQGDFIQNLATALEPGRHGVLMFDGFDAARGEKSRAAVLNLIRQAIGQLAGKWTTIVTVRSFDAQKSQNLLQLFPNPKGKGTSECRQFNIPGLDDQELEQVFSQIAGARAIFQAGTEELRTLLRVPFNLWLVERILSSANTTSLSRVTSEVQLLDLYWDIRVRRAKHSEQRNHVLKLVAQKMVKDHTLSVRKEYAYDPALDLVWSELLSDEILSPSPQSDQRVGFTHNILFDFAVSALFLDDNPASFAEFIAEEPARPLFLRPSLVYHFTRLWHAHNSIFWKNFWGLVSKESSSLRQVTWLILPTVVITEARTRDDLKPLIEKLQSHDPLASSALAFVMQALRILTSSKSELWVEFIESISGTFDRKFIWDSGVCVSNILAGKVVSDDMRGRCGRVGRKIMAWVQANSDPTLRDWLGRLRAFIAIPIIGKTYATNIDESRAALEPILKTVGQSEFPIEAVHRLIDVSEEFVITDPAFVGEIYRTIFSYNETSEEITSMGGYVVPMSSNRRQDYDMCRYSLIQLYPKFLSAAPSHALAAGVESVQEFAIADHIKKHLKAGVPFESLKKPFLFRGRQAEIAEDGSAIWDERYHHDREMELADNLFRWVGASVETNALAQVENFLDLMARRAVVAVLWSRLLRAGANHPKNLGPLIWELAAAASVLEALDTRFAMARFLARAFPEFPPVHRKKVEEAILALPGDATGSRKERLEQQRDNLIAVLKFDWLVTPQARKRKKVIGRDSEVSPEEIFFDPHASFLPNSEEDQFTQEGIDTSQPGNIELRAAYRQIKDWAEKGKDLAQVDGLLPIVADLLDRLEGRPPADGAVIAAAWTNLMAFTEKAIEATESAEGNRFSLLRRIILRGSVHEEPRPDPVNDPLWASPTWSSAPRNLSAQMLAWLTTYHHDSEVLNAIVRLAEDPVPSVRFLLFSELWRLNKTSSDVLWPLIEKAVPAEKNRTVFQGLAISAWRLSRFDKHRAAALVQLMLKYVREDAEEDDWNAMAQLVGIVTDYAVDGEQWAINQLDAWKAETLENVSVVTVSANRLSQYLVPRVTSAQINCARRLLLSHLEAVASALTSMNANPDTVPIEHRQEYFRKLYGVIDQTVSRIYFALDVNPLIKHDEDRITDDSVRERYFRDALPVLEKVLSFGSAPTTGFLLAPTAHYFMQLLNGVVRFDPPLVLDLAAQVVTFSRRFNYNLDSLAVREAVKLIETLLADFRDRIQDEKSVRDLLDVLDAFTEVGWPDAVNLAWKLDEIYR